MTFFTKISALIAVFAIAASSAFAQCIDVQLSIFSSTPSNGPTNVEWQVRNLDNVNLFTGSTTFNAETNLYETSVCLEPGCYNLRVVGNGVSNPETFYAEISIDGNTLVPTASNAWGTQVIEMDFCTGIFEGECNAAFEYATSENEPGQYNFINQSAASNGQVSYLWDFGDGTESDGINPYHNYTMNGEYVVCLYQTLTFEGTVVCESTECHTIVIDIFNNENCPTSMYASGECANWVFEVSNAQPGENVVWHFGNVVVDNAGHFIEHTFTESGVYNVCAYFTSELCPEGAEVCQEITVDICEIQDCNIEIEAVNLGNGLYQFTAYGNPEVYPMMWNFGDGTTLAATWVVEHQFAEPGQYEVCGGVNSELCSGPVTGCIPINYEGGAECTSVSFAIDSYIENGGSTFFEYSFVNVETEDVAASGVAQYSSVDPYFDQVLCLQNGCYYLTICTSNENVNWEAVNVLFSEEFDVIGWIPWCNVNGRRYLVSLNSKCGWEEQPCTDYSVEVVLSGDYVEQLNDALTIVLGQDVPVFVENIILSNENGFTASACVPQGCYNISIEAPVVFNGNISATVVINGETVVNETIPPAVLSSINLDFGVGAECVESVSNLESTLFELYPNPATNDVTIDLGNNESYSTQVLDITGKVVFQNGNARGKQVLNVTSFASGVYFVKIIQNNVVKTTLLEVR